MSDEYEQDDCYTQVAVIPEEFHHQRLDQVAAQLFPDFSRAKLQSWIKTGELTVDGEVFKAKDKARAGALMALSAEPEPEISWAGEVIPLDIVYEDEHVIVVNKPAGLVVHPGSGNPAGTLVNALLAHAPELELLPRGGIVHRLDKDTSGIMFVARSPLAHKSLVSQLSERTVKREYSAVCIGHLTGGGKINQPIGRHPTARTKMAVVQGGKPAVTHYRIVKRFANHTHIAVNLETGRTHQIRVHMAWKKYPLLGDPQYGGRLRLPKGATPELKAAIADFPRQALHAKTLGFQHPETEEWVQFDTELPEDLLNLLKVLEEEDA